MYIFLGSFFILFARWLFLPLYFLYYYFFVGDTFSSSFSSSTDGFYNFSRITVCISRVKKWGVLRPKLDVCGYRRRRAWGFWNLAFCGHINEWLLTKFFYAIEYDFFSCLFFFSPEHSRFTEQQGKQEAVSLIPHYHFHLFHRHFHVSSPLHIAIRCTRTRNLWFLSASH